MENIVAHDIDGRIASSIGLLWAYLLTLGLTSRSVTSRA